MIVVDVGCYWHPDHPGSSQDSVAALIRRFQPRRLYGLDPHPSMPLYREETVLGTEVRLMRLAVEIRDGSVRYIVPEGAPLTARTGQGPRSVPCVAVESLLELREPGEEFVVKLDVEGAEYPLLRHLMGLGLDALIDLLLVEWHGDRTLPTRRGLIRKLACPVEEWT